VAAELRIDLAGMSDDELVLLRAGLDIEMRKRKVAFTVGGVGERLVIQHFKSTPGLPKLQSAPGGTKNVDALSHRGDRYSIKTICNAKKTGTVYPDREDRNKQLFEFILIAKLGGDWSLESIYEFSWAEFVKVRSWDTRMNAWYIGCSASNLRRAKQVFPAATSPASPKSSVRRV
jgi:hypothetical protein